MGHLVLEPALLTASLPDFASKDQDEAGQVLITLAVVSQKTESGSWRFAILRLPSFPAGFLQWKTL